MGNRITHPKYGHLGPLKMSNGRTDVVLGVLVVSGSRLAVSPREVEFILWLAQLDQSAVGLGTVGFDLSEMPWTLTDFDQEKEFKLRVIEGAQARLGWEVLDFGTHPEVLCGDLEQIRMLILNLTAEDLRKAEQTRMQQYLDVGIDESMAQRLILPDPRRRVEMPVTLQKCQDHDVFLTKYGCFVCNNF